MPRGFKNIDGLIEGGKRLHSSAGRAVLKFFDVNNGALSKDSSPKCVSLRAVKCVKLEAFTRHLLPTLTR